MRTRDRWKPVLRGAVYCSPACGGCCLKADHDRVVKEGAALVKRLKGKGWRAVVHENLGWWVKVVSGPIAVFSSGGLFWCMISESVDHVGSGSCLWTPARTKSYKDPNKAVAEALVLACQITAGLVDTLRNAGSSAVLQAKVEAILGPDPKFLKECFGIG